MNIQVLKVVLVCVANLTVLLHTAAAAVSEWERIIKSSKMSQEH